MTHTPTVQSEPGGVPGRKRAISALLTVALTGGILGSALSQPASAVGAPTAYTASASTVAVTQQPLDDTVTSGDQATFSAAFSDSSQPVQWQYSTDNGTTYQDIDPATNSSAGTPDLVLPSVHVRDSGNRYRAYVGDPQGASTATNGATLTVNPVAPTVTQQPADVAVAEGENATFDAAFGGDPTPTVQWYKYDPNTNATTPISGATSPQLVLPSVSLADDGTQYYAVATQDVDEATTSSATLLITRAPALDYGPDDAVSNNGSDVTFSASANGYTVPTVQWQRSNDGGATFTDIAGATSYDYTFTPVSGDDGSRYRAVFTNGSGTLRTAAALLSYEVPPAITTQPASTTAEAGRPLTLTSAASGQPTPSAQWQVYDASQNAYVDISSATSPSYTFTPTVADDGKAYRVVYTNVFGHAATSAAATVRVTPTNPPSVPRNVAATQTGPGTVTITWDAPADSGTYPVAGYDVGLGAGQSGDGQTVGATARSAVFTGLANGDYTASVAAFSEVGSGPRSAFVTVTVTDTTPTPTPTQTTPAPTPTDTAAPAAPANTVAPSAPRAPTAALVGPGAVTVTWTTPSSSGTSPITGYTPGYSQGQSGNGTDVASTVRSYTFRNLAVGTYSFSVGATSADGTSPRSAITFTLATQAAPTISVTSPVTTVQGRGISFTGRGTPGATLTLQRLVLGEPAYTDVRPIKVASNGTYTVSVAAFKTAVYRMHEITGKVSSHCARITVASRSTLTAVRNGLRTYTLSGDVLPGTGAGQKITIAYLHNGAYVDLASGNTDAKGHWTFSKTYRSSATYTFRVTVAATRFNTAGETISRIAIR